MSPDLRLREELGSTPTPSEKGGCAGVERSALHGDVHHGSNSALRNPDCKGACISCLLLGHLETLYRGTFQVASLRFVLISVRFVAGLRRSPRLQYVKKSVNNPSSFAGQCTPAPPPFFGQPSSQRRLLPHLELGPLPGPPRGPHPAPQPGLQQGRRREYQCFGATANLKSFRTVGGLQSSPDVKQPAREVNVPFTCTFYEKGRSACLLPTRHSAQL